MNLAIRGKRGGPPAAPTSNTTPNLFRRQGTLCANHFEIRVKDALELFRYDLSIEKVRRAEDDKKDKKGNSGGQTAPGDQPVNIPTRVKTRVVKLLLLDLANTFPRKPVIASNYVDHLITVEALQREIAPLTHTVTYFDEEHSRQNMPRNPSQYNITISEPIRLSVGNFKRDLSRVARGEINDLFQYKEETINAYTRPRITDIGLQRFLRIDYNQPQFPPLFNQNAQPPWNLTEDPGLEALPGYFRSVRAVSSEDGSFLDLNLNTTTSAFYKSLPLDRLITAFYKASNTWQNPLDRRDWKPLGSFLKGVRVKTTYLTNSPANQNNQHAGEKIFTINGFPAGCPRPDATAVTFTVTDAQTQQQTQKTVRAWFQSQHNITLNGSDLVVQLGTSSNYTPVRLLEVLPGQRYKRKTAMAQHAARVPAKNHTLITGDGLTMFGILPRNAIHGPASLFGGITTRTDMVVVKSSILAMPSITYRKTDNVITSLTQLSDRPEFGNWNLAGKRYIQPAKDIRFAVLAIQCSGQNSPFVTNETFSMFRQSMLNGLRSFGVLNPDGQNSLTCLSSSITQGNRYNGQTEAQELNAIKAKLSTLKMQSNRNLVITLLPEKDSDLYGFVKRAGDQMVGINTVCCVCDQRYDRHTRRNFFGPQLAPGYIANLTMKINLKLSSESVNQGLQPLGPVLTKQTMVVGYDVTHPGVGEMENAASVAAMVASVDPDFAQWPASLADNPRPEGDAGDSMGEVLCLQRMTIECLKRFRTNSKRQDELPDKIVIYRDGLSEEQFRMCTTRELPLIRAGISDTYKKADQTEPPLLLICAVKRHHVRFFPHQTPKQELHDREGNPRPGTLVTDRVTRGGDWDFSLTSQQAIQGTARPTHYVILEQTSGLDASTDQIAAMTHNLSYMFGRATRSVGVTTPAYYADLAAERARCYVRNVYEPRPPTGNTAPAVFVPGTTSFDLRVHPDLAGRMFYI